MIGPGTQKAVEKFHLAVDLLPEKFVAEGLVEKFVESEGVENQTILLDNTDILSPDGRGRGIAIFHTMFNVVNVAILIWFIPWLVKTATKMVKSKGSK